MLTLARIGTNDSTATLVHKIGCHTTTACISWQGGIYCTVTSLSQHFSSNSVKTAFEYKAHVLGSFSKELLYKLLYKPVFLAYF